MEQVTLSLLGIALILVGGLCFIPFWLGIRFSLVFVFLLPLIGLGVCLSVAQEAGKKEDKEKTEE